jgi:hypothetical protein
MLKEWGRSEGYEAADGICNCKQHDAQATSKGGQGGAMKGERSEELFASKTARGAALEAPGSSQVSSLLGFFELIQRSDPNEFARTAFEANNPNQNNPNWLQNLLKIHSKFTHN